MTITVYTHQGCEPCEEVIRLHKEGKYDGDVKLVDIETDDGFKQFKEEVLVEGDGAVPVAVKDGQVCRLLYDTNADKMLFNCPQDDLPSSPSDLPDPLATP